MGAAEITRHGIGAESPPVSRKGGQSETRGFDFFWDGRLVVLDGFGQVGWMW